MMSQPATSHRISTIVIARNAERYIASALESILASTRVPDEILVVDGGSTDGTRDIASSFPTVRVEKQVGKGIANAYNQGVQQATGNLISFLSSDDRWLPEKLQRQEQALMQNPHALFVVCHVQHALEEGCNTPPGFRASLLDGPVVGYIPECTLAHRALFERVGKFDESFAVSEDTDFFARVRDAGIQSLVLPESLVWKRVHDRNSSLNEGGINHLLLRALRGSLQRKRSATPDQ